WNTPEQLNQRSNEQDDATYRLEDDHHLFPDGCYGVLRLVPRAQRRSGSTVLFGARLHRYVAKPVTPYRHGVRHDRTFSNIRIPEHRAHRPPHAVELLLCLPPRSPCLRPGKLRNAGRRSHTRGICHRGVPLFLLRGFSPPLLCCRPLPCSECLFSGIAAVSPAEPGITPYRSGVPHTESPFLRTDHPSELYRPQRSSHRRRVLCFVFR